MPAPKEYQGHRSWNAWSVALTIANDYDLYKTACVQIRMAKGNTAKAARVMRAIHLPKRTPDGALYNQLSVMLALDGLEVPL